jgi:hypothetical protein
MDARDKPGHDVERNVAPRVGLNGRTIACIAGAAESLRYRMTGAAAASQVLLEKFSTPL